ncbi:MAG: serine hydrolase [Candidatus Magasanikbacteria bacterium]|nr:serine hydrolase [Candidatus Magasanikbacteria bacterium]
MHQIKKTSLIFFIFVLIVSQFIFVNDSWAATAKKVVVTKKPIVKVVQPGYAKILTYFVADESGQSLQSKNIDKVVPIASLTKMMTALILIENITKDWNDVVVYNPQKHFVYGNYLKLKKGDSLTVRELLNSMLIGSVNEPPKMLIEATNLTEEEFVAKMNAKAQVLGMGKTIYVDTSGISPKNVSTSAEQAKLLEEIYQHPELREVMETTVYEFDVITIKGKKIHHRFKHTNTLLNQKTDFSILASKTGYLDEAKNNLAMVIQKNGRIYYSITMGDPSRCRDFTNTVSLLKKTLPQQVSGRF